MRILTVVAAAAQRQ